MLGRILLLTYSLTSVVFADLCEPGAPEAFKVRISVKAALGDKAYTWNSAEEYLFRAVMAFTMRSYTNDETFQISNILLCNVTKRVSFWFLVTSPSNDSVPFPGAEVEAAIRYERNRINSAFLLNDKTLEFLGIPPTMVPVIESQRSSWLIVFGVIVGLTSLAAIYLAVSGITRHMKKKKTQEGHEQEPQDTESAGKTNENRLACDNLSFIADETSEEALTHF